jgi:HD-like signal output (HDOD) protein
MSRLMAVSDLVTGMRLREDVTDRHGRLIISAGTTLHERHLRALKLWGVSEVRVHGDSLVPPPSREPPDSLLGLFALSDLNHPMIAEIIRCLQLRGSTLHPRISDETESLRRLEIDVSTHVSPSAAVEKAADSPPYNMLAWLRTTSSLPSLPAVYDRMMRVMEHPRATATDIANVLQEDPALTTRVLRLVNSALFAFPGKIELVSHAIAILGTQHLRDLVFATSVVSAFHDMPTSLISVESFWRHSVATSIAARALAVQRGEPNPEGFFVAGLIHDIGILVLSLSYPKWLARTLLHARDNGLAYFELEKSSLGYTHADIGASLLEAWKIPERQRIAVAQHHNPQCLEAAVVHVADILASSIEQGHFGEVLTPPLVPSAWQSLGLEVAVLPRIIEDVENKFQNLVEIIIHGGRR